MRPDPLRDAGSTHGVRYLPLDRRLVQMKARRWTPPRIATDPRGRKHKLPGPVRGGVRILPIQRKRQYDPPESVGKISLMLSFHLPQVSLESILDGNRQHRPPILLSLASPNDNFMPVEVDVLHSQLETFLQPQPGPIEQRHDYPYRRLDVFENLADFFPAEDDRDPMRHLRSRHLFNRANLDP